MKTSMEAWVLREKRNAAIRAKYEEMNKEQKWTQAEIYHRLSERFYLLERQLHNIVNH